MIFDILFDLAQHIRHDACPSVNNSRFCPVAEWSLHIVYTVEPRGKKPGMRQIVADFARDQMRAITVHPLRATSSVTCHSTHIIAGRPRPIHRMHSMQWNRGGIETICQED